MEGLHSPEGERYVAATVCLSRPSFKIFEEENMLIFFLPANMDDFISRWKTFNFSQEQLRNSV